MPRVFIAIRPPEPVRDALLDAMSGIDGARWQDDDQLHCTLAFLGELAADQLKTLIEALEGVESPAFPMEVAGVGHFERKGMASAVWAAVPPSDPLAQLQRRTAHACRRAGLELEKRHYRPHITLARLGRSAGQIGNWLSRHGCLRAGPWMVTGFTLYESRLLPTGAVYDPLVDYEF